MADLIQIFVVLIALVFIPHELLFDTRHRAATIMAIGCVLALILSHLI